MSWFVEASKRRKWLVGVSGGADSVALLHLLLESGFRKLVVCHLDHRLRGADSTRDARFVEKLAAKLELPAEIGRIDVKQSAEDSRESMETAGRRARHDFFRQCAAIHRCDRVVLAHHADDQAETILWNLLRGSHGLKGMKSVQRIDGLEFHRPLLGWRRNDLREWLGSRGIRWREDATNARPVAIRNRMRNEVIPLLDEIAGRDVVSSLVRLEADWTEQSSVTRFALEKADAIDPQGRIHLSVLRSLPPEVQRAVLADHFSREAVPVSRQWLDRSLETLVGGGSPALSLPGGRRLRRRAGRGFIE